LERDVEALAEHAEGLGRAPLAPRVTEERPFVGECLEQVGQPAVHGRQPSARPGIRLARDVEVRQISAEGASGLPLAVACVDPNEPCRVVLHVLEQLEVAFGQLRQGRAFGESAQCLRAPIESSVSGPAFQQRQDCRLDAGAFGHRLDDGDRQAVAAVPVLPGLQCIDRSSASVAHLASRCESEAVASRGAGLLDVREIGRVFWLRSRWVGLSHGGLRESQTEQKQSSARTAHGLPMTPVVDSSLSTSIV
jgi:hypothetical protein